ncbi:MAG TPA: hypothetical protein VHS58_00880 [Acetobacteraceae bacterium]|nr:hypothetical protein [Acetobacteraceae bacterium]
MLLGAVLLVDPYDTGRFPSLGIVGVDDRNPRTANVSRGRDPRFDSAIVANSTGQLLQPTRLDAATGFHFTQLSVPQTGPREQFAAMRWVVEHHDRPGALILVADESWCSPDPVLALRYPFPFWLYGNDANYLANVLNWKTFDRVVWRVQLALGKRHRIDPVGYSDYSSESLDAFRPLPPDPVPLTRADADAGFPWIDALGHFVAGLRPNMAVVIVMPPVQTSYLPVPGSFADARFARCKGALTHTVAGRPHSGFLDFRIDTPETRDEANFFDRVHFKNPVAREIEDRIIAVLQQSPTLASTASR